MKKWIHASKKYNIDSVEFTSGLVNELKKILPKKCWPKANAQYNEILVDSISNDDRNKLYNSVIKALKNMGYDVYQIAAMDDEGYEIAAVSGESFVKLVTDIGDYFNNPNMGYIDMKFDNGNVLFEDWYED